MTAPPLVLQHRRGAVLILTLNRPDRLNAWTNHVEDEYFTALLNADDDPSVRAVVVTGAGRAFCAGADLTDLADAAHTESGDQRTHPRDLPLSLRKPLICAINGAAVGLGLVEALYCDVRFSVPEAKLATAFSRRGLIAEYGAAWLLPRLVGLGDATDLLLSGRTILGTEAHRMGLVNYLSEPHQLLDDAVRYADEIATHCSPRSLAIIKSQLRESLHSSYAESAASAEALMHSAFESEDVAEGVTSFLERRQPRFPRLEESRSAPGR